ncbi:serine hydrolase domain-containing protein [Miniphocaeibacter halophilus]|uniref:Serine hydrolase n=1 Tax=Miniphocaeibacter halophilus TaxID=2931922 RepID=A0AC61MTM0_9FIRM|nr:serine hydrolase [Miniphocaeibacter halophilus]QQK08159.1 serine hydrolase [Miniphocaeibacter halophilus]
MNKENISNLNLEIKENYENINGIMVIKNGEVLLEEYFNNKNKNDRFNVASVTKSVLSAAFGIALDKGYIKSLDDKVVDYFPEYELSKNRTRDKVKIHELLSMTAPYSFRGFGQKLGKLINSENWIEHCLSILGLGGNNSEFKYSDASAHLLSGIITKTTSLTTREFTNKYLCSKISMTEIPDVEMKSYNINDILFTDEKGWLKDKQGLTIGGWGLTLTLEDMAKFGLLYLNNGLYKGEQIISKDWIEKSTKDYSKDYGYLWWLRNIENYKAFYAMGTGGNIIAVIPKYDLVIAIASKVVRTPLRDRWDLIDNFILPYVV